MKPGYWSETQRVVAQRTNNYSVYYYSYLSAPQLESQDFFFDINHLNARGAIRFTELLNSAMNQGKQNSEAKTRLISTNIVKDVYKRQGYRRIGVLARIDIDVFIETAGHSRSLNGDANARGRLIGVSARLHCCRDPCLGGLKPCYCLLYTSRCV